MGRLKYPKQQRDHCNNWNAQTRGSEKERYADLISQRLWYGDGFQ
jgi:hypothetical protein